jgi:Fic family protein
VTYEKILEKWKSYNISNECGIDKYLHSFRILFAYNSGKIENGEIEYHDTREIFENGKVCSFTGNVRTLFEQQNQKDCYEILKHKIISKEKLSVDLIKQIHFELCKGTYDERRYIENGEKLGEFKKHDYVVGITEVGSDAEDVERDLTELTDEINGYYGDNILKAAAYFHANFENIHPFADGNGRVGRTLLNYFLMVNNHPPVIIYDEDKNIYYEALTIFDKKLIIEDLYTFLKDECVKTWSRIVC